MKKLTIAERREKELDILISYKTSNPTPADYKEARKIMNSYYRLCGLANRNLMLTNNENTYNRVSTHKSEERESKWFKRLQKNFQRNLWTRSFLCVMVSINWCKRYNKWRHTRISSCYFL